MPGRQFGASLRELHQAWDEVSWRIARLRDNPVCADAEHEAAAPTTTWSIRPCRRLAGRRIAAGERARADARRHAAEGRGAARAGGE